MEIRIVPYGHALYLQAHDHDPKHYTYPIVDSLGDLLVFDWCHLGATV